MPRHTLQPLHKAFKPSSGRYHRNDENMWETLDRVQVLGENDGHRGCVNALSWSEDGSTLLSGSDDKRICIWQPDSHPSSSSSSRRSPHPMKLSEKISTGHKANIFSAKFLPNASTPTIVSCAGDRDVRVLQVERLVRDSGTGELIGERGDGVNILKCHKDRTKRIATENSPYLFMTVSEDGTVRQHDLRRPHRCRAECPEPLFYAPKNVDLYSLSVSTVTPHIFAVAGRTDCAFICDRRMLPRQTPSWGPHVRSSGQVHCVRKLGLPNDEWDKVSPSNGNRLFGEERHITCVKMSPEHPDEVAVAFAKHSTSLFSIYDSPPSASMKSSSPSILPSDNGTKRRSGSASPIRQRSKSSSTVIQKGDTTPSSPLPGSPAPFIPAHEVPHRPTSENKHKTVIGEEDDADEDTDSALSLGKRRQSDRESLLTEAAEPSARQRTTSEVENGISGQNQRSVWPFGSGSSSRNDESRRWQEERDDKSEQADELSSSVINAFMAENGIETEQPSTGDIEVDVGERIGPPTPPGRGIGDFLIDEEDEDMADRLERGEPTLSDMEEMALDILEQDDYDDDEDDDEDEDDDALDEYDEDEDMEMDQDDEDEGDDGDIEVDQDFMDPDVGILGFGGSNASRIENSAFDKVETIYPRRSYKGARNVETVKDCNFLGTRADKVCSGSDDGNFFVWDKDTGRLEGIWEGDGSVVNVMEQHPTLPLVAVSGIDNTVKMFAPTHSTISPSFSRTHLAQNIMNRNTRLPRFLSGGAFERATLLQFLTSRGITVRTEIDPDGGEGEGESEEDPQGVEGCATQ
ncbi:uncharacterized protein IL334_007367 [Kwoniella shivajii]|uniref:WD40 repeat-like protein n=1 Tax=Kwoniella shivajii TaxID=564305 RepID=A0ABZ1DAR4_9TREE|nr:hypothetical protein IL334_007367 [Kwoniella shivajii]